MNIRPGDKAYLDYTKLCPRKFFNPSIEPYIVSKIENTIVYFTNSKGLICSIDDIDRVEKKININPFEESLFKI